MKEIRILVCRRDGTQALETREVPDDYGAAPEEPETPPEE